MLQKNQLLLEVERKWREAEEFRREMEEENIIKGRRVKILEEGMITKEEKIAGFEKEIVRFNGLIGGLRREIQEKTGRSREIEEERDQLLEISNQLTAQIRKLNVVPSNNNYSERIEKWMRNIEQKIEALTKEITNFKANSFENKEILEEIQNKIYAIGTEAGYENLRDFFKELYEILLGQTQGPRLGSFFKLYGIKETIKLIESKLSF